MEHYTKGQNVEIEPEWNFPGCNTTTVTRLDVIPSMKLRDVIDVALNKFKTEKQVLWVGSGPAAPKAISIVEIVKKRIKNLHQITQLHYKIVEEYWEPKLEGLDRLKVTREIPAIAILLSKDVLDTSYPGYQSPGSSGEELWKNETQKKKSSSRGSKPHKNRNYENDNAPPDNKNKNWRNKSKDESKEKHWNRRQYYESRPDRENKENIETRKEKENVKADAETNARNFDNN